MKITKIKQIAKTNRYHVYVDDKWSGVFLDEILAKENLKTGEELDEQKFNDIKKENDNRLAFDMAASYLEKYNVSTKGIKDYLKKKGFSYETIKNATEKLCEYGFLNDEAFAKNYFESLSAGKGKRAIASKLKQKGVKQEIIDELISNVNEDDEIEKATIVAVKFAKNRQKDAKLHQKCLAHLIYKGYDYSVAEKAARIALEGKNEGEN